MDKLELLHNLKEASYHLGVDYTVLEAIPKNELIKGVIYLGECRNSSTAKWEGTHFEYPRIKFGYKYIEQINHFEDDDGYDVFVPVRIKLNLRK